MSRLSQQAAPRLSRWATVAGLTLVAIGTALWAVADHAIARQSIEVSPRVNHLGTVASNGRYPIHYSLRNTGPWDVTIFGVGSSCSAAGCIAAQPRTPAVINPGETFDFDAAFIAREPGPFACAFRLYTDEPGQTAVLLRVDGVTAPMPLDRAEVVVKAK